jgi:hypothetical protein
VTVFDILSPIPCSVFFNSKAFFNLSVTVIKWHSKSFYYWAIVWLCKESVQCYKYYSTVLYEKLINLPQKYRINHVRNRLSTRPGEQSSTFVAQATTKIDNFWSENCQPCQDLNHPPTRPHASALNTCPRLLPLLLVFKFWLFSFRSVQ